MSRYDSASHVFYRCQYHIVWTPKYRYKILKGNIAQELARSIYVFCNMKNCRVVELNVQPDHVHLVVRTPPSQSVSDLMVSAAKSAYLPSLYCTTFFAMGSSGTFQGSRASSFSRLSASPICAST